MEAYAVKPGAGLLFCDELLDRERYVAALAFGGVDVEEYRAAIFELEPARAQIVRREWAIRTVQAMNAFQAQIAEHCEAGVWRLAYSPLAGTCQLAMFVGKQGWNWNSVPASVRVSGRRRLLAAMRSRLQDAAEGCCEIRVEPLVRLGLVEERAPDSGLQAPGRAKSISADDADERR